jgi:beta-lactam-binding protein with PASTA domain
MDLNSGLRKIFTLRNLGWAFVAFLIFLLVMVILDLFIMPLYTKHGKEYELPDVTDKPVKEAIRVLDSTGFDPIVKDSVYDEKFSPGAIIQQNPLPYTMVKKGRRVYLVVSIGEKPIYVPRVIGLTPQDAEFRLKEKGLNLKQIIYEFSDFYMRGTVMNQSIPAGEAAKRNQRVNITVSLGPPPTSLEIPNLVGKSLVSAEKELDVIGVKVGIIKYSYRPNLVPGTVLNQSVSPGTSAAKVESINLLVSTDEPPPKEIPEDTTLNNGKVE